MDYPNYKFYCTLLKSRRVWPCAHHNLNIIAERCGYSLKNHHHALADADACAAIAIKLFNPDDDPYFMEASDIVYQKMKCQSEPVKCAQLSEHLGMERKVVDLAMKHLKEDGKVTSPKRGYWIIQPY